MQRISRIAQVTARPAKASTSVRKYAVMANTNLPFDTSTVTYNPIPPIVRQLNQSTREVWAMFLVKQTRPMIWDNTTAPLFAKAYVKFWMERKMLGKETEEEAVERCTKTLLEKEGPQDVPTQIVTKAYGKNWALDILEFYKNAEFSQYAKQVFYPFLPTTAVDSLRDPHEILERAFKMGQVNQARQKYEEEQLKLQIQQQQQQKK